MLHSLASCWLQIFTAREVVHLDWLFLSGSWQGFSSGQNHNMSTGRGAAACGVEFQPILLRIAVGGMERLEAALESCSNPDLGTLLMLLLLLFLDLNV